MRIIDENYRFKKEFGIKPELKHLYGTYVGFYLIEEDHIGCSINMGENEQEFLINSLHAEPLW